MYDRKMEVFGIVNVYVLLTCVCVCVCGKWAQFKGHVFHTDIHTLGSYEHSVLQGATQQRRRGRAHRLLEFMLEFNLLGD